MRAVMIIAVDKKYAWLCHSANAFGAVPDLFSNGVAAFPAMVRA